MLPGAEAAPAGIQAALMTGGLIGALGGLFGLALGLAAERLREDREGLADAVDRLLPQIQCGQCGFPGCRPYAEAIAARSAPIDRCPPGGQATTDALARLLGEEGALLDPAYGAEPLPAVAWIDEAACVGCAICLDACPVDAIVGAPRFLHTVIAAECTGCELCIAPCPVDCIVLRPLEPRAGPAPLARPGWCGS